MIEQIQYVNQSDVALRVDKFLYDSLKADSLLSEYTDYLSREIVKQKVLPLVWYMGRKGPKPSHKLPTDAYLTLDKEELVSALRLYVKERIAESDISPESGALNIVDENKDYLIIDKPHGIAVHPGVSISDGTLANYVKGYLVDKGEYDDTVDCAGIVHRLDKSVSGLMVIAKNRRFQNEIRSQFENHQILKVYSAKLAKYIESKELIEYMDIQFNYEDFINDYDLSKPEQELTNWYKSEGYIARSKRERVRMAYRPSLGNSTRVGGKKALSFIKPVSEENVYVVIRTGRMHQIRATLSYLSIPILGDTLYGKGRKLPEKIALRSVGLKFNCLGNRTVHIVNTI